MSHFFRRLLGFIPILFGISLLMFALMHAVPGGPWDTAAVSRGLANIGMDGTTRKLLERHYFLDQPQWKQYLYYMIASPDPEGGWKCGAICGNLGPSYRQIGRQVEDVLFQPPLGKPWWDSRFGYSLRLTGLVFLFVVGLGVPLGVLGAVRPKGKLHGVLNLFLLAALSIPNFVLGLLLLFLFATTLHLIPVIPRSWANPSLWILPAFVLSLNRMAAAARLTRSAVLQVMGQDYVRTARAKGVRRGRLIWKHIFKNAAIPIITFLGPTIAELLVGSVIIESMFSFPGFGREYFESIVRRDYSMIMGATLIYAILVGLSNLSVDLIYGWIDPRTRAHG